MVPVKVVTISPALDNLPAAGRLAHGPSDCHGAGSGGIGTGGEGPEILS
jgi:hypothetical protein